MKNSSKVQVVATIGPVSTNLETLRAMIEHGVDVVRLNFSWGNLQERTKQIELIRQLGKERRQEIIIIIDLPGPRLQEKESHTYDRETTSSITDYDKASIEFGVKHKIDYIAVSFVAGVQDILKCREIISSFSGIQKIIAKIERVKALELLDEIISVTDAVMIARGDLGKEVPFEQIPFIQENIIRKARLMGKPVIVATEMLLSMVDKPIPTRAEVTDVANAILQGADAVMLSEETAIGKYPVEAVATMERVVLEAEKHLASRISFHPL